MKSSIRKAGLIALAVAAMPAMGCAPMAETSRIDIDYSRADFRNRFIEDRTQCRARGGRMVIMGWGGSVDRDGIPTTRVRYTCT